MLRISPKLFSISETQANEFKENISRNKSWSIAAKVIGMVFGILFLLGAVGLGYQASRMRSATRIYNDYKLLTLEESEDDEVPVL